MSIFEYMRSEKVRQFSFREMERATNNFGDEMVLGSGGEGKVYKGVIYDHHTTTNVTVAVKVLDPRTDYDISEELWRMKDDLNHPNIISVVGYCNESPHRIVVYEYMARGSLADHLDHNSADTIIRTWTTWLSWRIRVNTAVRVAEALEHLHGGTRDFPGGIIHRDVKPSNILLDENFNAKLSDFGLMKECPDPPPRNTQLKGTPGFIAPEYITNHQITNKIDVYSFGMVLFQLLCGKSPWKCTAGDDESYYPKDGDNFGNLALENIDSRIIHEISQDCLQVYTDLIGKTLQSNPAARPTMHQVVLELEIVQKMQQQYESQKSYPEEPTEPQREDISRACHIESAKVSPTISCNSVIL